MRLKIKKGTIFKFCCLFITLFYFILTRPNDYNLDSLLRTEFARSFDYGSVNIIYLLFIEFIPSLIAKIINDALIYQNALTIIAVIIFTLSWERNPLHLIWFSFTPMGRLLVYNIQPFFIATSLFYWGYRYVQFGEKLKGIFLLFTALFTHWASLILLLLELIIYPLKAQINFRKIRLIISIGIISLIISSQLGIFDFIIEKSSAYKTYSGNINHCYFAISLSFITFIFSLLKIRARNINIRLLGLSSIIIVLLVLGQVKAASRIAFFSDTLGFVFFVDLARRIISYLSNYFPNTKANNTFEEDKFLI